MPRQTEKSICLSGFSRAWKKLTITIGFASGNTCSKLCPGPPETLEPDKFSCCPRDQSLLVEYNHFINFKLLKLHVLLISYFLLSV